MKTIKQNENGFVLLMSVLILTAMLMAGSYLLSNANSENKIANVQFLATKNYYLAETGISDMIWKIQNNEAAGQAFLDGTLSSSHDITRTNVFGDTSAAYQVAARNTVNGEAWITSTSTYQIGGSISQRVVKTYVSQALGNVSWNFGVMSGGRGAQQNGNFRFIGSGTILTSTGGRLHSNQEFKVQGGNIIINTGAVTSSNVINTVAGGQIILNDSYQDAPTTTVDMLIIDFDSSDPNSWKNRADWTYSEEDFENLANNTTLNGIIYVTGDANINEKNMTINGVLVAEGDIDIDANNNIITVNADAEDGGGLLAKNNINIDASGGTIIIDGLIYAANNLEINSSSVNFTINGSMTGFDARVTVSGNPIILNYIPENFLPVIDPLLNPSAPLIQIDHWEEQY